MVNALHTSGTCPSHEIAAYLDGELSAADEMCLELHMAGCRICADAFNSQKLLLNDLEHTLRHDRELELPENFTKVIVASAESSVTGIRRSGELFNALFVAAALVVVVLFALGPAGRSLIDQLLAVGSFFGHLIYSFFLGVTIILRNIASQFPDRLLTTAIVALSFGSLMLASRKWLRLGRA